MSKAASLAVAVLLALCGNAGAAGDRADARLSQELMRKSGLTAQIRQLPQFVQAGMDRKQQEGAGLAEAEFEKLSALMRSAFDPKALEAAVQAGIEAKLPASDARAALEWLDSPLGRKITRLEESAGTPEGFTAIQSEGPKMLEENSGTARLAKLKRLDAAIRATESSTNVVLNVQLAMLAALTGTMEADRRPSYKDVRDLVLRNRAPIRAAMERSVRMQMLYTYREITDFEIDRYVGFAESAPGRQYHAATSDAVSDALVEAARTLGRRIGMKMEGI